MIKDIEGNAATQSGAAGATLAIGAEGPSTAKALLAFTTDPRAKRIALFGAMIVVAALTGAAAGGLAAMGFMRPVEVVNTEPVATIYDTRILDGAITLLRADLMALKASVEADASRTNAQLAKFANSSPASTARKPAR